MTQCPTAIEAPNSLRLMSMAPRIANILHRPDRNAATMPRQRSGRIPGSNPLAFPATQRAVVSLVSHGRGWLRVDRGVLPLHEPDHVAGVYRKHKPPICAKACRRSRALGNQAHGCEPGSFAVQVIQYLVNDRLIQSLYALDRHNRLLKPRFLQASRGLRYAASAISLEKAG